MRKEFVDLPEDAIFEYIQELQYPDIEELCQTNRYFSMICQKERFQQIIGEKRDIAIKIRNTAKAGIAFGLINFGRRSRLTPQPVRGNLVIFNNRKYIVLDSFREGQGHGQLSGYIISANIIKVDKIVRDYAIINLNEEVVGITLIYDSVREGLVWKDAIKYKNIDFW